MTATRVARTGERQPSRMISHWEPPGSYPGRPFYSWYLTFDGATDLHNLVGDYASLLRSFPLDIVPTDGLHLTLENVGYVDEIDPVAIRKVGDAAAVACQAVASFEVVVDRAVVHPEAVLLLVAPREPVDHVRQSIRRAIAEVVESGQLIDSRQANARPDGFVPHITVAYSRSNDIAAPLIEAIKTVDRKPVRVKIDAAHLLAVYRAGPAYRWTCVSTAWLRSAAEP